MSGGAPDRMARDLRALLVALRDVRAMIDDMSARAVCGVDAVAEPVDRAIAAAVAVGIGAIGGTDWPPPDEPVATGWTDHEQAREIEGILAQAERRTRYYRVDGRTLDIELAISRAERALELLRGLRQERMDDEIALARRWRHLAEPADAPRDVRVTPTGWVQLRIGPAPVESGELAGTTREPVVVHVPAGCGLAAKASIAHYTYPVGVSARVELA